MQTCDLAIAKIRERRRADLHSFTNPAKMSDHCTCQRKIAFNNFPFGDVLGSEGRKALNACVKVKIYGKPEVRRYDKCTAWDRFYNCYVRQEGIRSPHVWIHFDENTKAYTIVDIHNALVKCDTVNDFDERSLETCCYSNRGMYEQISEFRADVETKCNEFNASTGTCHKYTREEAQQLLQKCYCGIDSPIYPDFYGCGACANDPDRLMCIFEIRDALCKCDSKMEQLHKYPEQGPGSDELKRSIDAHRADLKEEYENSLKGGESRSQACKYSRSEAERRVRDCYASAFTGDVDLFPQKKDQVGMPRIYQAFDIFDIKTSLDYFDRKLILERYPDKKHITDELKRKIEENRASIECEYKEATAINEIEHGSGFIIQDHFVVTNRHVIETYLDDKQSYEIRFSNKSIGELSCKVAHVDPGKDLALLYCPDLNLQESEICPLQLSTQQLLPGMQIFSFGYPMSHTEETALFVNGNVSGSKRTPSGHSKAVLNCSLNSGNSGGPVLSWVDGEVRVVGVATQKHFSRILTRAEMKVIENLRESMQAQTISDVEECDVKALSRGFTWEQIPRSCQVSMNLLTLKLYDALETHSQFNLGNALPGDLVVKFIKNFIPEYKGEHKEELIKVVELSQ